MPQAADVDREEMIRWFGSIMDDEPVKFLESHGFTLTDSFEWEPPVPAHTISAEEISCLYFLLCEWDYGLLIN